MGRNLPVLFHLGSAAGALPEVVLHDLPLVGVDRVEGERAEQGLDLLVPQHLAHSGTAGLSPASASRPRIRLRPERIRLFTVPSGWPSIVATSR